MNIDSKEFEEKLEYLYGKEKLDYQKRRYRNLFDLHGDKSGKAFFASAPGRIEICGNHTDHNNGKVLCASITADTLAAVSPAKNVVTVKSLGYQPFSIDLTDLSVHPEEYGKSSALVRGVARYFDMNGYKVGGFTADTTSDVFKGAGVSSSAAFEVLVGKIFSYMFNDDKADNLFLAYAAHFAETEYFGKPCGLLDQMAIALGGVSYIDFKDPSAPEIETIIPDLSEMTLVLTNTGGDHSNLTEHYASIRKEMEQVASCFGKKCLREVDEKDFYDGIVKIKDKVSKRAIMRAMHFYGENVRVEKAATALKSGDIKTFCQMENESGNSSYKLLQNCYVPGSDNQPIPFALALADKFGVMAKRVHGGGFMGTTLTFVRKEDGEKFVDEMKKYFGNGSVFALAVRPCGAYVMD